MDIYFVCSCMLKIASSFSCATNDNINITTCNQCSYHL
jgi:hypothetical protein